MERGSGNCSLNSRTLRPMGWLVLVGPLSVIILNCGCTALQEPEWLRNGFKVGPNYSQPSAPVAPEWIESRDPRIQAAPPRDGNWWNAFQDPILNSLICAAYRENPSLRAIGTRVLQARAQRGISIGNLFPQSQNISGLYDYGSAFGPPAHIDLTSFNLSWEIDFWGKYRRQVETANANLDASVDNYDDALVTLLADVATNYVQYRVTQQRIKIARENLRTQEKLVSLVEQQRKVGTATLLDVQQIVTLTEQTRSTIPALQITLGQANDRLCILVGIPPHDLESELGSGPELGTLPKPGVPMSVGASIPADLLSRRPDVRSAERQVAAQSAQIGVAKAGFYPSISVGTMLGTTDIGFSPLLATHGFLAFVTPEFSWNILNYGRIANNVRLQESKTDELVATYQYKVLSAAQEVQTALRGFLRSQEQSDSLGRSAAAAYSAAEIEEKLFLDIKADVNRLFTLENALLQAQDQLAVARGNIALNLIGVYRALGGGWELRTQEGYCRDGNCGQAAPPGLPMPRSAPQGR
jgi:NodT family efflux transporter outer membrane factor (OMF) lipoprotein